METINTSEKFEVSCTKCGTNNVAKNKFSARAFAISFLLLGIPIPIVNRTYFCFDCRNEFKKSNLKK